MIGEFSSLQTVAKPLLRVVKHEDDTQNFKLLIYQYIYIGGFRLIKYLKNDRGLSLIEVVAALLIIGIVLISFFGLLVQSNKTTHKSNDIMDATYAAQVKMEEIYNASSGATSYEEIAGGFTLDEENPGTSLSSLPTNQVYKYLPHEEDRFTYNLIVETFPENDTYKNAVYIHLEVIENSTNSKATMENVYILGRAK